MVKSALGGQGILCKKGGTLWLRVHTLTLNMRPWKGLLQLGASPAFQIPLTEPLQLEVRDESEK